MHYRVLCCSRCHVPRVSTWSRLITVSRVTMRPGRESDSYCLLLAAAPRTRRAAPATGHCSSSGETADIGHGAICSLSPLSLRFRDLDKLTLIAAKIPHSTLLKPTVNNPQDKPKSLRMCSRVCSWIGWLPSFNLSLQGKWICCKPVQMNLLQTVPLHFVMLARARFRVPFLCGQENIWMFNQLQQFWWSGDGDCSKLTARDEAGRLDGPATENEFCNLLRSSVRKIGSVAVFLIIGTMEIRHHVSNFQPIMKCIRLKGRVAAGICGIEI